MPKRKRDHEEEKLVTDKGVEKRSNSPKTAAAVVSSKSTNTRKEIWPVNKAGSPSGSATTVQVIVGTYEKVLHGITATILPQDEEGTEENSQVKFADNFLFTAHGSAIRCLAISQANATNSTKPQKVILASGSSDQIINLYQLSTEATTRHPKTPSVPTLADNETLENSRNRELGSLQHHNAGINVLYFPTRSKLLSGAEDNTIAVTRTRDWTVLSTIKAPIPKAHGRPSGDTAPLGGTPAGINDFAIHPSMKLMLSVGKGEKCMRLWNLLTAKKAGVLNFDRSLLQGVGEGRWGSGEGRRVAWNHLGEEFVVAFERGCVVFGMDSKPKCRVSPSPSTKIHQLAYVNLSESDDVAHEILAISTEDGRILFYSTSHTISVETVEPAVTSEVPICEACCQLGGVAESLTGRIKDFQVLTLTGGAQMLIVTGSSDGAIRLWYLDISELESYTIQTKYSSDSSVKKSTNGSMKETTENGVNQSTIKQIGKLLGTYEAGNRITCLQAFLMTGPAASEPQDGMNTTSNEGTKTDEGTKLNR